MKLPIKIRKPTRRCRCHVPGCRNRDAYKITRRDDVNGNPLYLCADCIKDIYADYMVLSGAEVEKKRELDAEIEAEMKARAADNEAENAKSEVEEQPAPAKPKSRSKK